MTRLIDADALLKEIREKITRLYGYEKRAIENLITNAPTVQREGWVSVEDRLPELYELVLVFQDMTGICLRQLQGSVNETEWYDENNNYDDSELDITHWQPLPAAPTDTE